MNTEIWMLVLAVVLLLEGIAPLLFPRQWQQYLSELSTLDQNIVRRIGGSLVIAGVVLMVIFS